MVRGEPRGHAHPAAHPPHRPHTFGPLRDQPPRRTHPFASRRPSPPTPSAPWRPRDPKPPVAMQREGRCEPQKGGVAGVRPRSGRRSEAEAVLAAVWRSAPARILLETCSPLWREDDAESRLKRLEVLAEWAPHDPEGHLAAGEAAVAAAKWGVARRHLMAALPNGQDHWSAEAWDGPKRLPSGCCHEPYWRRNLRGANSGSRQPQLLFEVCE